MEHRWAHYNDKELETIKRALEFFFWGVPGSPDDMATADEKIMATELVHEIAAHERGISKETKTTW
jgi:hypothetical protein